MLTLSIPTGTAAFAADAGPLNDAAFGARYISYRNESRFVDQSDDMELGHIIWPGGTLAETRGDRYGFEHEGLYNPATGKPGLTEMMALANAEDAALTIIIPTSRYLGREGDLSTDLQGFLGTLLSGSYGALPKELILEVGSEYYAHFDGATAAADYATVADTAVTEIALSLSDPALNTLGADLTIGVQMGKTPAEDDDIRDGLSEFALANTDLVIHHRFAFLPDGIDARVIDVAAMLGDWETDIAAAGGEDPGLSVSAWNVATQTRADILADFLTDNPGLTEADIDLDGRTTTAYEAYWRDALDDAAYGAEHPGHILETFHSYAAIGMEAGGVYGVDGPHPGRFSLRGEDGQDYVFAGGEMLEMLYEAVDGTTALAGDAFDKDAAVSPYAFESDDKLIVFLAAGDTNPGAVTLDIEGLGSVYLSVRADSLTAEIMPGWMDKFGVPDNPAIDETNEAWTYALGTREGTSVAEADGGVSVTFGASHEVIRLAFAKSEAGALEIAGFSDGPVLALDLPPVVESEPDPEPDADDDLDILMDDGGSGGGAAGLAGILPLLLLLL